MTIEDMEGPCSTTLRNGMIPADEIKACPFCARQFVKPPKPVAPIFFHAGVTLDGSCVLAGMSFREQHIDLLNMRADAMQPAPESGPRYCVTANMRGPVARGARAQMVVSTGPEPYSTHDRATAERVAEECRSNPEGYYDVRVEEVD